MHSRQHDTSAFFCAYDRLAADGVDIRRNRLGGNRHKRPQRKREAHLINNLADSDKPPQRTIGYNPSRRSARGRRSDRDRRPFRPERFPIALHYEAWR